MSRASRPPREPHSRPLLYHPTLPPDTGHVKPDPRCAPCSVNRRRSSFERDVEMRRTEQQTKRNVQLLDLVHRLGLDRGFVSLLGDFMITAAIPAITNASKSISIFWSCAAPGLRCPRASFSVFRLAIARTPPRPDRTFVMTLRASRIPCQRRTSVSPPQTPRPQTATRL